MTGAIAKQPREEFTTKALTRTDRFEAWNHAVNSAFVPLSVAAREPEEFHGGLINQTVGPVFLSAVSGTASHVSRGSKEIQANDPGLVKLGLQLRGYSVVAQDGREAALTPGDFAIYDTTRPYDLYFDDAFRMMVVMFPPEALHLNRKSIAALTASRVSGRQGLGSLTSALLGAVAKQLQEGSVADAATVSDALMNLISAVFAERVPPSSPLSQERLALMERIEAFVAARLGDPELTVRRYRRRAQRFRTLPSKAVRRTRRHRQRLAAPATFGEMPYRPRGPAPADAAGLRRGDALGLHRRIQLLARLQNGFWLLAVGIPVLIPTGVRLPV